jgi:GNAT superfamily N-acetyltransferase
MMDIRLLAPAEFGDAIALAWRVFQRFEAPEYSAEGVKNFQNTIHNPAFSSQLSLYGAYAADTLVGMIATRSGGSHIALFFVEEACQRQGIGKALFQRMLTDAHGSAITVNSSPFAVPVYQRFGFTAISEEQVLDGIRFTPMRYEIHPQDNSMCD